MQIASLAKWLLSAAAWIEALLLVMSAAVAEEKIDICNAGLITLASFDKHIETLRGWKRYSPEDIDKLVERQRKGGPEFFSSQIVIQEEQSGSGTFDLYTVHGIADASDYRNVTAWVCYAKDYPIVYFIGFRVRKIEADMIHVSREKDVVNVISLAHIDPKLDKHLKVKIFEGDKVLCSDLGAECDSEIFYSRE